ncbi:acylphosphatase [Pseudarthrobacter sp. NamE5]|uniref:acylphosphatase n=1 Tax=Pseudarthrobacter sp. NamE5 TaxID=2576839 RepID=UPI00110BE6C7|nr:acylphosphatase [Pseudarthrobacter sp. NamE5]TLM84079.1 acylphosphatase [Pseudarthrobacter sp. NamE5]
MARHAGSGSGSAGPPDAETVRLDARVYGMVQGVGFRYWTMGKAEELGLTGEVRNLNDGSVALVAEGPKWKVHELREWLNSGGTPGRVERVEDALSPAEGNYRGFSAR